MSGTAVRGRGSSDPPDYDVLVAGGGNAALCAALTAREAGCRVAVVERAPRAFRGGNSRHTRNLRCAHDAPTSVLTGAYPEDEFFADLLRVMLPPLRTGRWRSGQSSAGWGLGALKRKPQIPRWGFGVCESGLSFGVSF